MPMLACQADPRGVGDMFVLQISPHACPIPAQQPSVMSPNTDYFENSSTKLRV